MYKRVKNLSLRYKISVMTFLVALLPLLLFCIIITFMYGHAIEQRSRKHIDENIRFMSNQLERVFSDGILCTNYLTLTMNSIEENNDLRQVDKDNAIFSALNQTILIFDGIDSILFLDERELLYSTQVTLKNQKEEILESTYMQELIQIKNGKTVLFDLQEDCMQTAEGEPVVTMGKKIINIVSGESMGYLFININSNALERSIQNQISCYLLLDQQGNCVAGTRNEKLFEELYQDSQRDGKLPEEAVRYKGEKYLIREKELEDSGWSIVGITNLNEYNVSAGELIQTLLLSGAVTLILLIFLIIYLSKVLTKPLTKLIAGAEEVSRGNLDVRFHYKSEDEIGRMGSIFNYMSERIAELFLQAEQAGRKKREYELALIQEQVKPHFLYNTLDIIIMLIDMNKPREAARVTKKLADYYKKSLSSSEEIIILERELQMTEDYLQLQRMRYGDKFTYEIRSKGADLTVRIPKMTLQPLVENALYHGLKCKEGWGTIVIEVSRQEEFICLQVCDNGIGMTEESLEKMLALKEKAQEHFGVYSVNHRLMLYYGEAYSMQVESAYGIGTRITIRIPGQEQAEKE